MRPRQYTAACLAARYRVDRLERYLAWYEKYLKSSETSEARR
jgi:hypothetical protein